MKKYMAEMIGTMILVLMGCGSAVFNGGCGTPAQVLMVAMAFGLSVVAMAYTIGGISGCHINPAITLGCMLSGRMKAKEGIMYMVFQVMGALIGSTIIWILTSNIDMNYATTTGANVCAPGVSLIGGLIAEVIFFFCICVGCIRNHRCKEGSREFGRSSYRSITYFSTYCLYPYHRNICQSCPQYCSGALPRGEALSQLWIFIIAPFVGAALAAGVWKSVGNSK